MEQKILHDDQILDNKEIWYSTYDPDFYELSARSRVTGSWLSYQKVLQTEYVSLPVKPLNNYVYHIAMRPELNSIVGNTVSLRFLLYADIYLDTNKDGEFYNVDRTWIRQYYQTKDVMDETENTYEQPYKFFVPWFIDYSGEVEYKNVLDSPFIIKEKIDYWFAPPPSTDHVSPHFVTFKFKNTGPHMRPDGMGVPRRGDPVFDMHMRIDDIIVLKKIEEQYANNQVLSV